MSYEWLQKQFNLLYVYTTEKEQEFLPKNRINPTCTLSVQITGVLVQVLSLFTYWAISMKEYYTVVGSTLIMFSKSTLVFSHLPLSVD